MKNLLYRLARTLPGSALLNWAFAHVPFVIPSERLRETDTLVAFNHPSPSHALHILIVPKEPYRSIMEVPSDANEFMIDLVSVVKSLVRELELEDRSYRLIMNGGSHQDVKHLHFHLISDDPADPEPGSLAL